MEYAVRVATTAVTGGRGVSATPYGGFGVTSGPGDDSDLATAISKGDPSFGIFIESGGPDSYMGISVSDATNFINDTLFPNGTLNNTLLFNNGSDILSPSDAENLTEKIVMAVTSVILGLMILITVIGNVFVIAAIILERNLQNVANYLVASLAVADLLVACLVMPLSAVYEISKGWILGPELCDIWTSCDVLCCTASILHLVAIATDRYWAVTQVDYIHSRTSGRVTVMIGMVWVLSIVVSLAPQFGWKDPEYMQRIEQQKCMVSQDVSYQVFATCSTFYVPLLVILVLYWKIYQTARKRIHRRRPKQVQSANNNQVVTPKKKSRLRFRLASKFTNNSHQGKSSLGLVQGHSTNTVNTVEDTEYSSNDPTVSRIGEVSTTQFNNGTSDSNAASGSGDETPSTCQIATVSHQVSNQQQQQLNSHHHSTNGSSSSPVVVQHHHNLHTPTTPVPTECASTTGSATNIQLSAAATAAPHRQTQPATHSTAANPQTSTTCSMVAIATPAITPASSTPNPHTQVRTRKETLEAKRERKAAKTLAIITGAFVVCWLPFFLMAIILPLCESCQINDNLAAFFLWLGYFNSTLNPVIYTIFSPEFRQAFKRILFGHHRGGYYRGGKL